MPAKVERCVKSVMEKQGVSESRAWAICNAAMNDYEVFDQIAGIVKDAVISLKARVDDTTGFLTAPVKLSRTGVQYYMGYELGIEDRALEKIGVLRHPDDVFDKESIESFVNLVATDDHPSIPVHISNVKDLQVGMVSGVDISADKSSLDGILTITDELTIQKIQSGKLEVSVGYSQNLIPETGVFNGDSYEYKQTDIRANHLAIVKAGRCGPACKITVDHNKRRKHMIITIDGITYEVEDAQLAQAIRKMQDSHNDKLKALDEEMKAKEEEVEENKKKADKAQATADALVKDQLTEDALSALITDRAVLISTAKEILGDEMPECGTCPKELKTAVVDKAFPDMDLDGKSDDYLTAMYDLAVKKLTDTKGSLGDLGDNFIGGKKITTDEARESARAKYMKDMGMEVE